MYCRRLVSGWYGDFGLVRWWTVMVVRCWTGMRVVGLGAGVAVRCWSRTGGSGVGWWYGVVMLLTVMGVVVW